MRDVELPEVPEEEYDANEYIKVKDFESKVEEALSAIILEGSNEAKQDVQDIIVSPLDD